MSEEKEEQNEMGVGAITGFQIPLGIKQRKKKVDELLSRYGDINELLVLRAFSSLTEGQEKTICECLDKSMYEQVADAVREIIAREIVQHRMKEIVRKKPGGGGYVLYNPNKGKKKNARPSGTFPTKLGAKRAELARFPPRDSNRLSRLRKEIERLLKRPNPEKKLPKKVNVKENFKMLQTFVKAVVSESLFREENSGSEWDERLTRLSKQAVTSDKKFQNYQRSIEKKTAQVLNDALAIVQKAVKKGAKLKSHGIKHSIEKGKTYLGFEADLDGVTVGPMYIYVENGVPKIEVSDHAKMTMTKAEPDLVKKFRAELITVQERVLDRVEDLVKAVAARDKYLVKIENEVDSFLVDMTPLQLSMLKSLLVKKYRKL